MATDSATPPVELRSARKVLVGSIVSDKMQKTRIVEVAWQTMHARYGKVIRRSTRLYAHDEANESHMGDKVEIIETRPLSKTKRWRVVRILEKVA